MFTVLQKHLKPAEMDLPELHSAVFTSWMWVDHFYFSLKMLIVILAATWILAQADCLLFKVCCKTCTTLRLILCRIQKQKGAKQDGC